MKQENTSAAWNRTSFFEAAYMRRWDEELTARLQPLESIFKRLPKSQPLSVRLRLWKSGEPLRLQTCRWAQLMALVDFGTRVKWRLKRVDQATKATKARVGYLNESRQFCNFHLTQRVVDFCSWA